MRILLCTDGSSYGQAALCFGALIARASPEPAMLLGVMEQPGEQAQIERALEVGMHLLEGAPAPQIKVRQGHAADAILDEAMEERYDLVVVGARGRRSMTRFLLDDVTQQIISHVDRPVLVARIRSGATPGRDAPGGATAAGGGGIPWQP